jgi:hypothetical protein
MLSLPVYHVKIQAILAGGTDILSFLQAIDCYETPARPGLAGAGHAPMRDPGVRWTRAQSLGGEGERIRPGGDMLAVAPVLIAATRAPGSMGKVTMEISQRSIS